MSTQNKQRNLGPHAAIPKVKQAHDQVTDGDALQHTVKAQVVEMKMRKAVDKNTQQEQDRRASQRVPRQLSRANRLA